MPARLHTSSSVLHASVLGLAAGLALAVNACGSAGEPPSSLPAGGASNGGSSSATPAAGASNAGSSNAGSSNAGSSNEGGTGGDASSGAGECNVAIVESPPASAFHLIACSAVDYSTNPPSGGDHYAIWAAFQTYDYPVPVGFVVHDLEHGAVAFWYNCPEGCADEVAAVQAFIDSQPEDPLCTGAAARRAVLVPDPALPSRWGASAWGFSLTADCFDADEFGAFFSAHYGNGPEVTCADGKVIAADACP